MANKDAIAVAVTDDDITVGQAQILLKLQDFHDRFQIPVTYFIEILRGIVLRGADFADLIPATLSLTACCVAILTLSVVRFHKRLA